MITIKSHSMMRRKVLQNYFQKEVDFMLTHEELMEKCQKVRYAVDALLNVMRVDDYIYKPDLSAHDYIMDKLIYNEESLLSDDSLLFPNNFLIIFIFS